MQQRARPPRRSPAPRDLNAAHRSNARRNQQSLRAWHHAAVPKPKASKRVASPKRAARATAKPQPAKSASAKSATSKAKKPATTTSKQASTKAAPAKRPGAKRTKRAKRGPVARPDFGAKIAGFFSKQPAPLRPILEALRDLVQEAAPDAASSLKWGMPFFMIGDAMMCAIGRHKSHVNLILSGPPGTYADPEGRLSGDGKTGRHLKLTAVEQIPRDAVRGWLKTAAKRARANP
jgi:hypothetical protein